MMKLPAEPTNFTSKAAANRANVRITGVKRKLNFRPLIVQRDSYEGKTLAASCGEVPLKSPARFVQCCSIAHSR